MFLKDPVEIGAPLNRIYVFTRRYRGNDPFGGNRLAFYHDRTFATDHLRRLVAHQKDDPFNYCLYDVWQLVYQKPWTRPRSIEQLIRDLADKIHRGELFVYEQRSARAQAIINELHSSPATTSMSEPEPKQSPDQPRTQAVSRQAAPGPDRSVPSAIGALPATAGGGPTNEESLSPIAAEPPKPIVRVEAGVFFDGTGNNRGNIQSYPGLVEQCLAAKEAGRISEEECSMEIAQESGDSYLGAETNVSKLEYLYQKGKVTEGHQITHSLSVYVEGVGTMFGDQDSDIGLGTGLGGQGLIAKTEMGAKELTAVIEVQSEEKVDELILDVFGFSRGAATARHFVNEVIKAEDGALGIAFRESGLQWPDKVTIRFLGIYDTVAAILNLPGLDFSPGNDKNDPANISLSAGSVQYVAHLTADHERRQNFALNSLRDKSGDLPPNFGEWALPGVHSDIGGGYHDTWQEEVEVRPPLLVVSNEGHHQDTEDTFEYDLMRQQLDEVEGEKWFGHHNPSGALEIRVQGPEDGAIPGQTGPHESLHLWMSREVRGEYSRITLHVMRDLAVKNGVPFKDITEDQNEMVIPDDLSEIAAAIEDHVLNGALLELTDDQRAFLKQRYIHHSDHYETAGPLYPFKAASGRKRVIHGNGGLQ